MTDKPDSPRFIERAQPAQTPAEARQRRSTTMVTFGAVLTVMGFVGTAGGNSIALLLALLGIGLLVGGLVIRP